VFAATSRVQTASIPVHRPVQNARLLDILPLRSDKRVASPFVDLSTDSVADETRMITAIPRSVATDDKPETSPVPGVDDVRRVLDVVVQALSVIAPLAARLRDELHQDDDAIAFEVAVCRAVESIRSLQPVRTEVIPSSAAVRGR